MLFPETGTGFDLVDRDAVTATLFGVPPASGHGERTSASPPLPMAEEDARAKVYGDEESLAEQNIIAGDRGAKHTRALNKYICRGCATKEG